ncbi:hypothetical protein [Nannocystis pusilla]|uniref:hypothetical protein n=1 Tax=Nannocystis pusilla TaxID=889268 RepID=UPI003DA1CDF2
MLALSLLVGPPLLPESLTSVVAPADALVIVPAERPEGPADSPQPSVIVTARTADVCACERTIVLDDTRALRRATRQGWASRDEFAKLGHAPNIIARSRVRRVARRRRIGGVRRRREGQRLGVRDGDRVDDGDDRRVDDCADDRRADDELDLDDVDVDDDDCADDDRAGAADRRHEHQHGDERGDHRRDDVDVDGDH